MSIEQRSQTSSNAGRAGTDYVQELAARLDISSDPFPSLIVKFNLHPNGDIDEATEAALKAMQRIEGFSLYEQIITRVDTDYARSNYAAGPRRQGTITDPYLLAHIPNAHELHRLNMMSIRHNVMGIEAHTFEQAIVAQVRNETARKIGVSTLDPRATISN